MKKQTRYLSLKNELLQQVTDFQVNAGTNSFFASVQDNARPACVKIILETDDQLMSQSQG